MNKNQSDLEKVWLKGEKAAGQPSKLSPLPERGLSLPELGIPIGTKTVSSCHTDVRVQSC